MPLFYEELLSLLLLFTLNVKYSIFVHKYFIV